MQLTRSQQQALTLDKNISVTAGAGSGKTRILVERFLKIVLQDPQLTRRVAAITFTEKAAGEMQERVALEVNNRLKNDNIGAAERQKLQIIRDQLKSAYISTIHGFCKRLLAEFPLEADIVPDFAVLDPIRQQILIQTAINNVFRDLDGSEPDDELFRLFLSLPRMRIRAMLQKGLEQPWEMRQIARRFAAWDEEGFMAFLQKEWGDWFAGIAGKDDLQEAHRRAEAILSGNTRSPDDDKRTQAHEALENFARNATVFDSNEALQAFIHLCDVFTTGKQQPYKTLSHIGKNDGWSANVHKDIKELSAFLAPFAERLNNEKMGDPPGEDDRRFYRLFVIYLRLQQMCDEAYAGLKKDMAVLDFEDLQIKANELLENNGAVRAVFEDRFRYIMVDEFQDTNQLQWQIVRWLAGGENAFAADKVFIVGDPKQSIYGFRNADVRVFRDVRDFFSQQAGKLLGYEGDIIFAESFRFVPRLNAFINFLFERVLQQDPDNSYAVAYEALKASRAVEAGDEAELAVFSEGSPDYNEADYIATRIAALFANGEQVNDPRNAENLRPLRYGDVAILLRDRGKLGQVEQALRRREIPFKTVGGIGFWQRQEIYDFYHILRFLANPADDLALVALLRSRLFLIPDNAVYELAGENGFGYWEKLQKVAQSDRYAAEDKTLLTAAAAKIGVWLELRERLSLADMLSRILEETALNALLHAEFSGDQRAANLQKVIELADALDQSGPGGLRALLDTIDNLINREVSEAEAFLALDDLKSVKIMTIHTSKGLQFPVVFVPYLNRGRMGGNTDILLDADLGMAFNTRNIDNDYHKDSRSEGVFYRLVRRRQQQKDEAEARRVFYVGLTRASDRLYLSATIKDKPKEGSSFDWLAAAAGQIGYEPGETGVFEGRDFTLRVVDSYDAETQEEQEISSFNAMMKQLEKVSQADASQDELLKPLPAEVRGRTFSATALMTFAKDPDEYYRRYHLGYFESDYRRFAQAGEEGEQLDSLLKGKVVHRFLELQGRAGADADTLTERVLFEYEIFDNAIRRELTEELSKLYARMRQSATGQSVLQAKNYRNEIPVTMRLGEDYFTGTLDRLQQNGEGNWEVIDYKTNKVKVDEVDQEGTQYDLQMEAYALLLSRLYPQQPHYDVKLFFLLPDRLYQKRFDKAAIGGIEQHFAQLIAAIKTHYPL